MFWKLHGPDLNGAYGGMQGTGGLEAVLEEIASPPGVTVEHTLRDFYGHHLRPADGLASQSLGYGPKPGAPARTIFEGASPAEAAGWRGRRADITGAVWLGARYYQPEDGRFLSADPAGHAASRSLYDYAGGDPVNSFDPDGRLWTTRLTESSSTQQFKAYTSGLLAWSMGDGTIALGVKMTHGMMTVKAAYGLQSDSDMILAPTILSGGIISEQALLEALRNGDLSQIIDQATKTATQGIHAFGIAGYMEKERALPDAVDHMVHGAGSALANGDYWGAAWRAGATALEWLSGAELARGASALFKMAQFEGRAACIVSGMVGYGGANVLAQGMVGVVSNEEFDWEEVKWSAATGGILHAIFGTCFLGDTPVATASGPRRIDSLRVGERVLAAGAENVESSVNPETWRHITLEMPNPLCPNDDTLHIEVLRGPEWIRALNAKPGAWIRFTLEEMGLDGWAQVTGIGPCPSIQNGVGRVVLATVNHLNSRVMELNIAGSSQPLHPTNSHLLFSATRNTWVPAEELLPGESLKTFTGVARAEKGSFLPGTYNVFNIEVEAAHCYFTGDVQILSHNACVNASTAGRTPEEIQSMIEYAKLTNGYLDKYGPQIIQSTKGALRLEASADAAAARRAAERAGQPFMGQAGHVPDTAITGMASPPLGYLDMAGKSNSAMGGLLGSRVGQQLDAILIDGVKY
jgi:RHS repeat-associated protein